MFNNMRTNLGAVVEMDGRNVADSFLTRSGIIWA